MKRTKIDCPHNTSGERNEPNDPGEMETKMISGKRRAKQSRTFQQTKENSTQESEKAQE